VALRSNDPAPSSAISLLGGVFDPVHRGHVAIALSALRHPQISEVRWIPCAQIPHHKSTPMAPAKARLEMARLICDETEGFVVDDLEYHREGPSYTVDTVRLLSDRIPDKTLLWIVGADNARTIAQWKSADELWNIAIPLIAPRPGVESSSEEGFLLHREDFPFIDDHRWELFCQWQLPPVSVPISSSGVRDLLRNSADPGQISADQLGVPAVILEFILAGGWYHTQGSCDGST